MSIRRPALSLACAALLAVFGLPAAHALRAAPAGEPALRPWGSLDAGQRDILAPLQGQWDTLPPRQQQDMLDRARHWSELPPDRRQEIRERIQRWQQMTPEQREQVRQNRIKYNQLPPEQRAELHAAYMRFQQLPPQQRDNLMRRWELQAPEQRRQWLDRQREMNSRAFPPPVINGRPAGRRGGH
jgi:Protein of unknown function (DUF3106)